MAFEKIRKQRTLWLIEDQQGRVFVTNPNAAAVSHAPQTPICLAFDTKKRALAWMAEYEAGFNPRFGFRLVKFVREG